MRLLTAKWRPLVCVFSTVCEVDLNNSHVEFWNIHAGNCGLLYCSFKIWWQQEALAFDCCRRRRHHLHSGCHCYYYCGYFKTEVMDLSYCSRVLFLSARVDVFVTDVFDQLRTSVNIRVWALTLLLLLCSWWQLLLWLIWFLAGNSGNERTHSKVSLNIYSLWLWGSVHLVFNFTVNCH